jgi:glycine cleavage system H protein
MNPSELKYTKEHEWVRVEGAEAVVGITDHAQSALGDITFIELPKVGRKVRQGDGVSTVESVKAASDIYTPVSGEIAAVNQELVNAPETVNKSAYEKGWIFKVKLSSPGEIASLMDAASYEKFVKES